MEHDSAPAEDFDHESGPADEYEGVDRVHVHVEIAMRSGVRGIRSSDVGRTLQSHLQELTEYRAGSLQLPEDHPLVPSVESIRIVTPHNTAEVPAWKACVAIHTYRMLDEPPEVETADGEEGITTLHRWQLPARQFDGLWDSLVFDEPVKEHLLDYVTTSMLFAKYKVNPDIVSCNRVILLHGPPGTGKTSLCKALAQKLAIRLGSKYAGGMLLEINAHSLFSKWFSESGKLVMSMFSHIIELVEEQSSFVCVLIDEVESLSAARSAAMAGSEPSDAIRVVSDRMSIGTLYGNDRCSDGRWDGVKCEFVHRKAWRSGVTLVTNNNGHHVASVNALLTQIDRLRTYENVLVLCTSNITGAIDVAFVDRADVKQYIGLPSLAARYEVTRTCIAELARAGLVTGTATLPPFNALTHTVGEVDAAAAEAATKGAAVGASSGPRASPSATAARLLAAMRDADGLSGRALRKLPLRAFAEFVGPTRVPDMNTLTSAIHRTVLAELKDRHELVRSAAQSSSSTATSRQ